LIVSIFVEVIGLHGGFPDAVKVKVTTPAAISAALGLYVHRVNEVALVNVPKPLEDQATTA
jgi:hypothetical protein